MTPSPAEAEANAELDNLRSAISRALQVAPAQDVLALITGSFVGLTCELIRRQGLEVNKEIKIEGGDQRDITIHAPKALAHV